MVAPVPGCRDPITGLSTCVLVEIEGQSIGQVGCGVG